jgi:hypothetical protein
METEELIKAINNLSKKDFWDYIVIIGSLTSTVLLFLTYFLASNINRKIDKPIMEKQLAKVYELIEILQNTTICVSSIKIENNLTTLGKDSKIKFFEFEKFHALDSAKKELLIQKSNYEKLEFLKYNNDPFVPKNIAQIIDKFEVKFNTKFEEKNKDFIIIGSSDMFVMKNITDTDCFISSSFTFEDFVYNIKEINREIINWIKSPKVELNLR